MSRRVIPAGDSLKDFHRAGGEPGPNRNRAKDSDPDAPGGLMTSCFARESHSRELHCLGGDLLCTDVS